MSDFGKIWTALRPMKDCKRGNINNALQDNSILPKTEDALIKDKKKDNKGKVNFDEAEAFCSPGIENSDIDTKLCRIYSLNLR